MFLDLNADNASVGLVDAMAGMILRISARAVISVSAGISFRRVFQTCIRPHCLASSAVGGCLDVYIYTGQV